ncbi:MAG: hypothetical protein R3212_00330 [Xanthomonadales bacterium]|nr:hypothetical protein [Xanthomonadales bacterium]
MPAHIHLILVCGLLLTVGGLDTPLFADGGTVIQGGHSGGWYNQGQPGHGVFAEVLDSESAPSGKRMVLAWYAFLDGEQIWILAVGDVVQDGDGQTAVMQAWIYEGNDFPPQYNPARTLEITWGEIRMYFAGCDDALLQWSPSLPGFQAGSLQLQRLTTISGTTCDPELGGIPPFDDHGNTWQTATTFPVRLTYNDFIEGRHENRDDVDVFVFTLTQGQAIALFTIGPADTAGTLYRIEGGREILVAEDDNSGINKNFLIEADLAGGTYSVHVAPTLTGIYGGYSLHLQTN